MREPSILRAARRGGALALVALMLASVPAGADDAAVRERVLARLQKDGLTWVGDIQVGVSDGAVTLDGAVTTLHARRRAEKAAAKESEQVVNRLRVVPEPRSDAEVAEAATDAILRYPFYTVFDGVSLAVQDGAAILRGSVRHGARKSEIEDRVARVEGVREIRNEIRVQPASLFDDQLRRQLYRAIYLDERFVQYANRVDPPIRILVENGRVTLAGRVASRVDQALLGTIARSTAAFSVSNLLEVEGEAPREDGGTRT